MGINKVFYHDGQGVVDIDKSENNVTGHVQHIVQPQHPAMTSHQGFVSFMGTSAWTGEIMSDS